MQNKFVVKYVIFENYMNKIFDSINKKVVFLNFLNDFH